MALSRDRWNQVCHLGDGVFFGAAMIVLSRQMVLPQMIKELSQSATLVGLVPFVIQTCLIVPAIFYAKRIEGLAYKKPTVLVTALLQRMWWVLFLASLFFRWSPAFTLTALFCVLAANSIGSGLLIPVWTDWYAKTVPERMWGTLLGLRHLLSACVGVALGGTITWVLGRYQAPQRYQILVGLGIVFYALSMVFVFLIKEKREEGLPTQEHVSWRDYFADLISILFRRADFRRFIVASALVGVPTVVISTFLTKYALDSPGVPENITGKFTIYYFGATALGAVMGGLASDWHGPMTPFRMFPIFIVAAAAAAALSSHPWVLVLAWCLIGFAFGAQMVVRMPAIFKFAGPHRRPTYMAAQFTVLGGLCAVVPALFGVAKDLHLLELPHVFAVCGVATVFGWLLFLRMPDPVPPDDGNGESVQPPQPGERGVFMHRPNLTDLPEPPLPPGYEDAPFAAGDEPLWADLLDDVFGDWDTARVGREFTERPQWSPDRFHAVAHEGRLVAVSLAWEDRDRWPRSGVVHWVGVREGHRGMGLGRYVVARNLRYFAEHDYADAILETQDYRAPAISLYLSLGLEPIITGGPPDERARWEATFAQMGRPELADSIRDDYNRVTGP